MNADTFKEKSEMAKKSKEVFKAELDEWFSRITEVMEFLNSNNCQLRYDGNKYNYLTRYITEGSIEKYGLSVKENTVNIGIYDNLLIEGTYIHDMNYLGTCIFNLEDFIADNWKDRLSKIIFDLKSEEKGKKMEMEKALKAGNLARRLQKLEKDIDTLSKGYADEWVVKNEHTLHTVELASEHLQGLVEVLKNEKDKVQKELSSL